MKWLLSLLTEPSAFPGDAKGHFINQSLHACIGAVLVMFGADPLAVAIFYLIVWEGAQIAYFGAVPGDAIEDACFVGSGAAVAAGFPVFMLPIVMALAIGAQRRFHDARYGASQLTGYQMMWYHRLALQENRYG